MIKNSKAKNPNANGIGYGISMPRPSFITVTKVRVHRRRYIHELVIEKLYTFSRIKIHAVIHSYAFILPLYIHLSLIKKLSQIYNINSFICSFVSALSI